MEKALSQPTKKFYYYSGILIFIGIIILLILNYVISPKSYSIILPSSSEINLSSGKYIIIYQNDGIRPIDASKIKISIKDEVTKSKISPSKSSVVDINEIYEVVSTSIMLSSDGSSWRDFYRFEVIKSGLYEIAGQYEGEMEIVPLPILIVEQKNQNSLVYPICGFGSIFLIIVGLILFFTTLRKSRKYRETLK